MDLAIAEQWESIWLQAKPGDGKLIIEQAIKRGTRSECVLGLLRSTMPTYVSSQDEKPSRENDFLYNQFPPGF